MFKIRFGVVLVACLLLFAIGAKADSFTLSAIGPGIDITATLTGYQTGPSSSVYDITGMSGTVNGFNATLLPTSGPGMETASGVVDGWEILYDNVLYMNSSNFFDLYGLGFTANGTLGNLYYSDGNLYAQLGGTPVPETVSISVVPTPEPSSLVLLVAGMVALMLLVIHRGRP